MPVDCTMNNSRIDFIAWRRGSSEGKQMHIAWRILIHFLRSINSLFAFESMTFELFLAIHLATPANRAIRLFVRWHNRYGVFIFNGSLCSFLDRHTVVMGWRHQKSMQCRAFKSVLGCLFAPFDPYHALLSKVENVLRYNINSKSSGFSSCS